MEISEEEYKLLKSHSLMLGQIGAYLEDFCKEDDTTLTGVINLLSEYHYIKSDLYQRDIDNLKNNNN